MLPYHTRFVNRDSDAAASREAELNQQAEIETQSISQTDLKSDSSNTQLNTQQSFTSSSQPPSLSSSLARPLSLSDQTAHEVPASLQPHLSSDDFKPAASNGSDQTGKNLNRFESDKTNEEFEFDRGLLFHLDDLQDSSFESSHRSLKQKQQLGLYEDPVDETQKYAQNRFISPQLASDHSNHSKSDITSSGKSASHTTSPTHSRQFSMTDADWNQLQEQKKIKSNNNANTCAVTGI